MKLSDATCMEFVNLLGEKKPVPGGGGAAALVGAVGASLNTMVANYSIGKKKLLSFKTEHENIIKKGEDLKNKLMELIDEDAENFTPLSIAYGLPSETDEEKIIKEETLQKCLKTACSAPVKMVEYIYESILLHQELVDIASKIMISDIGVGVQFLKAAIHSAQLNVIININSITDTEYVCETKEKTEKLVEQGSNIADEIFQRVLSIMND